MGKDCLSSLKVAELKDQCRSFELKVSGTKQELIDRLKLHQRRQARAEKKVQKPQKQREAVKIDARPCKKSKHTQHDELSASSSLVGDNAGVTSATQQLNPTPSQPLGTDAQPKDVEACKESPGENNREIVPVPMLDQSDSQISKSTNSDAELQAASTQAQDESSCKLACAAEVNAAAQHASEDAQVAMDQGDCLEQPAHTELTDSHEEKASTQVDNDMACELACASEVGAAAQHTSEDMQYVMDQEANLEQPAQSELIDCQGDTSSFQAQDVSVCELACSGGVGAAAQQASEDAQVTQNLEARLEQPAQAELTDCQEEALSIQAENEPACQLACAGGESATSQGIHKEAPEEEDEEVIEMPATASDETNGFQRSCHMPDAASNSTPAASTVQVELHHALPATVVSTPCDNSSKSDADSLVQPPTAVPSWASETERGPLSSRPVFLDRTYARLLEKEAARTRGEDLPASWTPSRKTTSGAASPAPPLASPTPARSFATTSSPLPRKTFAMTLSPVRKSPAIATHEKLNFSMGAPSPVATRLQAMEDGKQRMLKELTEQMQVCLRKMSARDLDSRTREKYQAMANSIKTQMDKLNGLPNTAQSPAKAFYSPGVCRSPLVIRGGGC